MKKSKQLTGLNVIVKKGGKIIGKISKTLYNPGEEKIQGFSISCGKWVSNEKILLINDIVNIGKDTVIINEETNLKNPQKSNKDEDEALKKLMGLPVITSEGEELGFVEDIILDEKNFSVEGYVLTDGIVEDILRGKRILPFNEEIFFGKDVIIISSRYKNIILKNDISLKRYFERDGRFDS
ncbi:PRC-barrel domain protein [Oxobacter pfennigii]|uniref:PRC-barrel domain protein n=1 Tax=Oxobacter pfennigii TaxID=36849 RepID=A0A0P8W8D8_9CLOT|nr:PRC-barrel domain-containing protein [Oxobacter pfennigii]KPU44957.1 PRC-barrel domain protein [Oxobacter pfennigii]